ncbi:MAG: hypothetical protein KC468_11945 [Myxococcales bacterium]|nr:hypothetical protein [Myxococcales bacterium]
MTHSNTPMLPALAALERRALPQLLREAEDTWSTLDVIYHPPRVERVWRQHGEHRVYLHRIWPCEEGEALVHPHDWPSAVHLLTGRYAHTIATPSADGSPTVLTTLELAAGSRYEMVEPSAWHAVRPLGGPALSLMITGRPYTRDRRAPFPKPERPQPPLDPAVKRELLAAFRERYPLP